MNRYIMGFFSVFPACAGVILSKRRETCLPSRIPRMRGGDPIRAEMYFNALEYSPHARG